MDAAYRLRTAMILHPEVFLLHGADLLALEIII